MPTTETPAETSKAKKSATPAAKAREAVQKLDPAKQKALDAALAQIDKSFGKGSIMRWAKSTR